MKRHDQLLIIDFTIGLHRIHRTVDKDGICRVNLIKGDFSIAR